MATGPQGARAYVANLALAADLGLNAALGGSAHQTFSARSWAARCAGKRWGAVSVALIDGAVARFPRGQPDHCRRACEREVLVLRAIADAEAAAHAPA